MYKFYMIPDATLLNSHAEVYNPENMKLFWDPYAESDAYGAFDLQWNEELNKASSLEFSVLPSNIHYNDFHKRKTVVIVIDEGEWLFEGVVSDAPIDFFKQRKVTVTSCFSYLCDSIQAPDEKNVVEVPVASTEKRYLAVPDDWYASANPKSLNWFEKVVEDSYEAVEQTDIFRSGVTYYTKNGSAYTPYTISESGWDGRPQLYMVNGRKTSYKKTNDTSANVNKKYYYEFSGDGNNHSGLTITSKAATKESISDHIKRLLNVHNSQVNPFKQIKFGQMYGNDTKQQEFKSSGYRTTWDSLKSDILDEFGKYFTVTRGSDNELYLNYLNLNQLPSSTVPLIEYTNNMIEMNEADNSDDDIFTVLVPTGKNNLTVDGVSGHGSASSNAAEVSPYIASFGGNRRYVVVSPKAVSRYGYIFKPVSFSDVGDADTLYDRAVKYIENNYDYHTEYEVKAIDLKIINGSGHRIRVGDRVRVHSGWHGVDISELYVISAEHDLANPENDTYKIGIPTSDREANNKTLTGQTSKTKSSTAQTAATAQAAIDSFAAQLSALMDIDEWGIHAHTKIENVVNSENMMFLTKFRQTEEDINLIAQKVFGPRFEDDQQQDAGYIQVPVSDYKLLSGAYKNPTDENWYEYQYNSELNKNVYVRSVKSTCDPAVYPGATFYIQRLWTRYSSVDVGPGGIKARVDGNYERSTASSSWIDLNEDSILALTGHLYVDEDGHVHVTSGTGMRTDHSEDRTTPTYYPVTGPMLTKAETEGGTPISKGWYERTVDSSGAWVGLGQADSATNDSYYHGTADTSFDRAKQYYYKSFVREIFSSKFGIYDEDNLTAGILVRAINNPTYKLIALDERKRAQSAHESPAAKGWYEYDHQTGLYGRTNDTSVLGNGDDMKEYFTADNNMQTYTNVMGDHVVIGGRVDENGDPVIFEGVDDATKARIHKYIDGNKLDGTITEIASDVLYAKAIFTNYLNVLSRKLIGDVSDDSSFVAVDKTQDGYSSLNPSAEGWFEKNPTTKEYFLSADDTVDPNKTYYITKLMTRVTSLDVGEGGIHATVTGNYERSIASAAWIEANEDKLEMLLGHIGEDENGNLVIDAGAGFKTGHTASTSKNPSYVLVERKLYSNANPKSLGWKERKIGSDGRWLGAGKADSATNDAYYKTTSDTTASYTKQYYVKSNTAESFISEYGIYDQGSLTAGVIAQAVNNPKYRAIERAYQPANVNPATASSVKLADNSTVNSQWYVYNESNGTYGHTTDTSWVSGKVYYYVVNNMSTYTSLRGEHIVIGATDGYGQLDADTQSKVDRYISRNNLDGTITEIASDVVTVNALIAKFASIDELENIILNSWSIETNHISIVGEPTESDDMNGCLSCDTVYSSCLIADDSLVLGEIPLYSDDTMGNNNFGDLVIGFGTITTSGDTVTIPYLTASDEGTFDPQKVLSFNKPASLGTVTWSSGGTYDTLVVKTAGDKEFFRAMLSHPTIYVGSSTVTYDRNGSNLTQNALLRSKPTLKATMNVSGTWTGESHDESEDDPVVWSRDIFFDASEAYNDGRDQGYTDAISTIRTASTSGKVDGEEISLGVNGSSTIRAQYKTKANFDSGAATYQSLTGIKVYPPDIGIAAGYKGVAHGDKDEILLDYDDSVDVTLDAKRHDQHSYTAIQKITVKSKNDRYNDGIDAVSVFLQALTDATEIPSGVSPRLLKYGTYYRVYKTVDSVDKGGAVYFQTPNDNSTTITKNDIQTGSVQLYETTATQPSSHGVDYTFNSTNPIVISPRKSYYLYFTVTVMNVPKYYRICINGGT